MALPLGKLTILVGAGIVGSVLAKEGRIPGVSDFFSGALKIALKQIKRDDSTQSTSKPKSDFLWAEVNNIREQVQLLASNRGITIVTSNGTGSSKYGIVVVVVVVGYGYIWWKGWKLPDMMFATKRSLSEASSKIAKQLETVYSSIAAAERHLSSRIKRVDDNIDECAKITTATRDEVSDIRGDLEKFGTNVQTVRNAVLTLESKISRIEGKQDETTLGVRKLCSYANSIQTNKPMERIQASPSSSSRSLEPPPVTPLRAVSLPPGTLSLEQPSPSSNGAHKVHRPVHNVASACGLKELHGISEEIEVSSSSDASNKNPALERNNGGLSLGAFGWRKLSGASSFIHRTRSATTSFK